MIFLWKLCKKEYCFWRNKMTFIIRIMVRPSKMFT